MSSVNPVRRVQWHPEAGGPIPSPCNNVCRVNGDSGFCEGCWRTLDEIVQWTRLDDAGKRALWQQLNQRAQAAVEPGRAP